MKNEKIEILFLTLNPNLKGPLPKHNPILIEAFRNTGCQVTRSTWGRHSDEENIAQKFFGRLNDLRKVTLSTLRLRPDIIFIATTLDIYALARDIPLLLTLRFSKAKKVLKMHGSKSERLVNPGYSIFKALTMLLISFSDAILLLSSQEIEEWCKFNEKGNYFRVDNPYIPYSNKMRDTKEIVEQPESCPTLLFVGRLIKSKGVFDLLDAMPIILDKHDCRLLFAGEGKGKKRLKQKIKEKDLESTVKLLGYLDDEQLYKIYNSSSMLILPTYFSEGFPTVITEAMDAGLPIITTNLRGAKDHLEDGKNALFIPPKDPKAIADAVLKLINNPLIRNQIVEANRNKIKGFLPERVVIKYKKIFEKILSN